MSADFHSDSDAVDPADMPEQDLVYVREQLELTQSERWIPPEGVRLAKELFGSRMGALAFVIGTGPSIKKAEKALQASPPNSFRIAINAAITKVPAEYWFFIDAITYFKWKDHPNAKNAVILGVDRFWKMFPRDVYIWQRAYELGDFKDGRLIHRATSLLASLHMAVWLGATRVVTVGCDNKMEFTEEHTDDYRRQYQYLFRRINKSLVNDTKYWKPSWCTLADASGGNLALPRTYLGREIERLNKGKVILAS